MHYADMNAKALNLSPVVSLSPSFRLSSSSLSRHELNKFQAALEEVYLPWGLTAVQHLIGCALVIVLWVVKARPVPRLSLADMKVVFPIAACHTLSHVCFAVVLGGTARLVVPFVVCLHHCVVDGRGRLRCL